MDSQRRPSLVALLGARTNASMPRWLVYGVLLLVTALVYTSKQHFDALSLWQTSHYQSTIATAQAYNGEHASLSLADFIRQHVGAPSSQKVGRGIWVSLADEYYVKEALSHARLYLDKLPSKPGFPRHDLVVLCIDEACVYEGRKRRMLTYGGFVHDATRPDFVRNDTWAKAQGLTQILAAGYNALFFDADVFLRYDVFEHMEPLTSDTWDLQIQDEVHNANVNTGFQFLRANEKTTALWRYVADQVEQVGLRDQAKVNAYLETPKKRVQADGMRSERFIGGPLDLRVRVLPTEYFWGAHLAWFVPSFTTILHLTCAPSFLKSYIAGSHGLWQDVDGLYSRPPPMLSLGTGLGGSREDVTAMFRLLFAAAISSSRAVLPPLNGHVLGPANADDGNLGNSGGSANITHSRLLWSLLDIEPLVTSTSTAIRLLEPNYPEHATKWLAHDHETLLELHSVHELDLRPINHFHTLVKRLREPPFRDALHVRLITDEGPRGFRSLWGGWEIDYPIETPSIRACENPERISACGDLCR